jgi:hypothetical protein
MIDVATGWSERRAILGRSWLVMRDAFRHILHHLPFPAREIHSDNGSEFLNAHLHKFWAEAASHISLSRSRPYQKNDNRFVEQKNSSLIRAYLGHERLDTVAQTHLLNQLYEKMDCYYNLFLPVMRLSEKILIPATNDQTASIRRRYDRSRTPFDRLCDTDVISQEHRQCLKTLRQSINPLKLREEIYHLRDQLFSLPNAQPHVTENAHDTLHYPNGVEPPCQHTHQGEIVELQDNLSHNDTPNRTAWRQRPNPQEHASARHITTERSGQALVTLSSDRTTPPR